MIINTINELKNTTSLNRKKEILIKSESEMLKLILSLTYDRVKYTFGLKKVQYTKIGSKSLNNIEPDYLLKLFEPLFTRTYTGNAAFYYMQENLEDFDSESQQIIYDILQRDLRCGINTKLINKVFKNLITEFPYMRCSLIDQLKNIKYPAMLQLKADGTYRTFIKNQDEIRAYSRSGEEYSHPLIFQQLKELKDGVYIGELICNNLEGSDASEIRYKSNGLLNSLKPPLDVTFYAWDFISLDEFKNGISSTPYIKRYESLPETENIKKIETWFVKDYNEALQITNDLIKNGEEGTILKNSTAIFKTGTSREQIKLKPEIEVDVKCIGFTEGTGKFKSTFGAIIFESSDGILKGQVSGLTDIEREDISKNRDLFINKILSVKATGVSKAKNSDTYALLFPRFNGFRNDKDVADDIERILNMGI